MKLRGLIFRELYLGRKNIILMVLIWIIFVAVGILMRLSMLYGNMANMPEADLADAEPALYNIFTYLPILVLMFANGPFEKNIFSDYKSKWSLFVYTTPVSEYKYVGAKFLLMTVMSFVTFALSLANSAVLCKLNGKTFDGKIILNVLYIVLIMLILFLVFCTLAYRFRSEKKTGIVQAGGIAVLYASAMGAVFYFMHRFNQAHPGISEEEAATLLNSYKDSLCDRANEIISTAKPFLLTVLTALIVLLYFFCVKAMKRRES